jgi:hypothetical protein
MVAVVLAILLVFVAPCPTAITADKITPIITITMIISTMVKPFLLDF